MLSAVTSDAPDFEGLRDYVISAARPTAVKGFDANARQPMQKPTDQVPGPLGPIPTSSARPGKQTNQRITYARNCISAPSFGEEAFDPTHIHEGDVVFVNRYVGKHSGHDVNRPSGVCTLSQLNAALQNYNYPARYTDPVDANALGPSGTDGDAGVLFMKAVAVGGTPASALGILPARSRDVVSDELNELIMVKRNDALADFDARVAAEVADATANSRAIAAFAVHGSDEYTSKAAELLVAAEATLAADPAAVALYGELNEINLYEQDPMGYQWRDCRLLAEWVPDGVCCGTEHEHRKMPLVGNDNSHPGELINVAIGGPAEIRNSEYGEHPQQVDDGMRVLDKVFVGLIAYEMRENGFTWYSYRWKLFTSRQLTWVDFAQNQGVDFSLDKYAVGGNNGLGPSREEFMRMVSVWRIGSVMDTKSTGFAHKCATINVVVEPYSLDRVRSEFNSYFGRSLILAQLAVVITSDQLVTAAAVFLNTDYMDKLRNSHKRYVAMDVDAGAAQAEVDAWREIDLRWFAQYEAAVLHSRDAGGVFEAPRRPRVRASHQDDSLMESSQLLYEAASANIVRLYHGATITGHLLFEDNVPETDPSNADVVFQGLSDASFDDVRAFFTDREAPPGGSGRASLGMQVSVVGRTAAILSDPAVFAGLADDAARAVVRRAVEARPLLDMLSPAFSVAAQIRARSGGGFSWPI